MTYIFFGFITANSNFQALAVPPSWLFRVNILDILDLPIHLWGRHSSRLLGYNYMSMGRREREKCGAQQVPENLLFASRERRKQLLSYGLL